tara:strand:- start:135 stop:1118 length:984 start_codon:yes stop_codon:yes gene_type:complete
VFNKKNKIFIVAEIGNNHEGSYSKAKKIINEAIKCGVDAVKFQTFEPFLYSSIHDKERYLRLKKFKLTNQEIINLSKYCKKKNVLFFSTPFDLQSAEFLNGIQKIFKISSGDNNFYGLIEKIANFQKNIIISTGLTDDKDLKIIQKKIFNIWKNKKLTLCFLHCVTNYPTLVEDSNLNRIKELQNKFKELVIGYSDHTIGVDCCKIAIGMGAQVIEKHFTILKNRKRANFRDHALSANTKEMAEIVKFARIYEKTQQTKKLNNNNEQLRRGFAVNKDLKKGYKLKIDDLIFIRPKSYFYKYNDINKLIGKKLIKNINKGQHLDKKDI